jgi:hypothetical protein
MVERFREQISTEKLSDRLDRILRSAARALGDEAAQPVPGVEPRAPASARRTPRERAQGRRSRPRV